MGVVDKYVLILMITMVTTGADDDLGQKWTTPLPDPLIEVIYCKGEKITFLFCIYAIVL